MRDALRSVIEQMRSVYAFLAFILALAIMWMVLILTNAGKCGLQFGFFSSLIGISLIFWLPMFIAAMVPMALVYRFGLRLLLLESALFVACVAAMFLYSFLPYGQTMTLSGRCQVNAP